MFLDARTCFNVERLRQTTPLETSRILRQMKGIWIEETIIGSFDSEGL
jgi:hypothetical protein